MTVASQEPRLRVQTAACSSLLCLQPLTQPGPMDTFKLQASWRVSQTFHSPRHTENKARALGRPGKTWWPPPPASPAPRQYSGPLGDRNTPALLGLSPPLLAPGSSRSTSSGILAALTPFPSLHSRVYTSPGQLPEEMSCAVICPLTQIYCPVLLATKCSRV